MDWRSECGDRLSMPSMRIAKSRQSRGAIWMGAHCRTPGTHIYRAASRCTKLLPFPEFLAQVLLGCQLFGKPRAKVPPPELGLGRAPELSSADFSSSWQRQSLDTIQKFARRSIASLEAIETSHHDPYFQWAALAVAGQNCR